MKRTKFPTLAPGHSVLYKGRKGIVREIVGSGPGQTIWVKFDAYSISLIQTKDVERI